MASAHKDDHLCLRCNMKIKGLQAYVLHRQNDCQEGKEAEEGTSTSHMVYDQELVKVQNDEELQENEEHKVNTKRYRKRKAVIPQTSPKKSSQYVSRKSKQDTPKQAESGTQRVAAVTSPDSPRRSSRRGIRISYRDLLSGVDMNDPKASALNLETSPVTKVRSSCRKKATTLGVGAKKKDKNRKIASVSLTTSSRRAPARVPSPVSKQRNIQKINESSDDEGEMTVPPVQKEIECPTSTKSTEKKDQTHTKLIQEGKYDLEEKRDSENGNHDEMEVVMNIKKGKFYCSVCDICCHSKKKLDDHCVTRKHAKMLKEAQDSNVFKRIIKKKRAKEDNRELLECGPCEYTTKNKGLFDRHLRSIVHAGKVNDQLYACLKCHRKYKTEDELQAHQDYHEIPRCLKCKEVFQSDELLEEHLDRDNHRIEYRCDECNKVFATKGTLKTHKRSHDPSSSFKCEVCPYTSAQYNDVKKHMDRHKGFKPFQCSLCDYASITKNGVERHMKVHTIRSKDFQCDECNMAFYNSTLLKQHKYMKHDPERKYPCPHEGCTFAFKYRSSLGTHERMHTQEKPFLCAECGYATSTKHSLTKHLRLHTGEKPFLCDYPNCNYRCRLSTHLARHKIIHTGAKPFMCPLCNYACNNKQNLRKHILTTKAHAGIEMYKCNRCDKYSSNSFRDYVVHIRKEHGGVDEYINFFDVADDFNKNTLKREHKPEMVVENFIATGGDSIIDEPELQSFSVVTVVPGRKGSREVRNISTLLDNEEDVKKLEQVIMSLENGTKMVSTKAKGNTLEELVPAVPLQVDSMGNIMNLATCTKATGEHGETIVIIPEVQAETEIQTSEGMIGTNVIAGEGGHPIQEYVVEFDHSGRPVTEEELAAAKWLHNMGSVQTAAEETVMPEEIQPGENNVSGE